MERLNRWENVMEWPLMATAVVFLLAYALPIAAPGAPTWFAAT